MEITQPYFRSLPEAGKASPEGPSKGEMLALQSMSVPVHSDTNECMSESVLDCETGSTSARISFNTIEMLAEWLQSSLGDKSACVGEALQHAFEEQARNAMGPKRPEPAPFVPPAALMDLLNNLPDHLQQHHKVSRLVDTNFPRQQWCTSDTCAMPQHPWPCSSIHGHITDSWLILQSPRSWVHSPLPC